MGILDVPQNQNGISSLLLKPKLKQKNSYRTESLLPGLMLKTSHSDPVSELDEE